MVFRRVVSLACLTIILLLPFQARAAADEVVQVRVLEKEAPTAVTVFSGDSELDLYAGDFDQPVATLSRGDNATISESAGQLTIVIGEMRLFAEEIRARAGNTVTVRVDGGGRDGLERAFPGELRIRPSARGLTLHNVVDLEEYVASVVTHEYGMDDLEGSKAMAVVARTYALRRIHGDGPELVDHVGAQVYGDVRQVTDIARQAARETRGEILTYGGEVIEAVYSSSSGGYTANNEDVWNSASLPYLRGKRDPFDSLSPHGSWTSALDRSKLLRALSRATGGSVSGFIPGEEGPDGRIRTVELLSTSGPRQEITANRFRLIINAEFGVNSLKSTNFEARRDGDKYVFEGHGFGHGVGMSQWGARAMAQEGHSYRDILAFYYTGVHLATHRNGEANTDTIPLNSASVLADADVPADDAVSVDERVTENGVQATADREETVTSRRRVGTTTPSANPDQKHAPRIGW